MFVFRRLIALSLLAAPILLGAFGWKLMRDAWMNQFDPNLPLSWVQLLLGGVCFLLGLFFMGGYILHRDRKKRLVQPRFRKDRPTP